MTQSLATVYLEKGNEVTMRKHDGMFLLKNHFRTTEKFRLQGFDTAWNGTDNISVNDVKGPILGRYKTNYVLKLLNLGNQQTKDLVHKDTGFSVDRDHKSTVHQAILDHEKYNSYNGTIITSVTNSISRPEEVILYKSRTKDALTLVSITL